MKTPNAMARIPMRSMALTAFCAATAWMLRARIVALLRAALLAALCLAICAATCAAQGSRKDDVVFGPTGRPMAGVTVAICTEPATTITAPCSPLASLYSDAALTQPLANPVSSDGLGNYYFYAAPGKYTIQIYGPGVTTRILPDVILPSDPSSPTFTSVTTTSGISAFSLSLAGNLAVSGSVSVAGTLTVDGVPITGSGGGGGASLSANNIFTGNDSFKGPIPYWDATAWGASGSQANEGASSCSGTTVTLSAAGDFANGEGVMCPGAGPASALTAPVGAAAATVGATASVPHTYKIAAIDSLRGSSAVATATVTNANATLTAANYVQLAWNPVSGSPAFYAIYKDGAYYDVATAELSPSYAISSISQSAGTTTATINQNCASCSSVIVGSQITVSGTTSYNGTFTVTATPAANQIQWSQSGSAATETAGSITQPQRWIDRGQGQIAQWPANLPATPPAAATNQWAIRTITAGGGTTTLTVSATFSNSVSGVTVFHDDTTAVNSATAACVATRANGAGGIVYLPAGYYNIFGTLSLPTAGSGTCTLQWIGTLNVANTVTQNGWHLEGLGGAQVQSFGNAPVADLNFDYGVVPVLKVTGSGPSLENVAFSQNGCEGPCVEVETAGALLLYDQAAEAATGPDAPLKFYDSNNSDFSIGGSYISNGFAPSIAIVGSGTTTPSNLVYIIGTKILNAGISIFNVTNSLGPNCNTYDVRDVLEENSAMPFLSIDSRDCAMLTVNLDTDVISDPPLGSTPVPVITINGPQSIGKISVHSISGQYQGIIGSSSSTCVQDLDVSNTQYGGSLFQGSASACAWGGYPPYPDVVGSLLATGPVSAQGGVVNGGHMNQSAANSDFAGASACVSGAKTISFSTAYSSTPVILVFDETTAGGTRLSAKSASSFAVACTGATEAFDYIVIGNPN